MIKINALFLMFLLSLNLSTSTYTEEISIIEPIHGYRSELVQLMNEAQNDSPKTIQEFSSELLKMLHSLMNAQAKHEAVNKKMVAQCLEEDAFRKKEVSDAQNALNASSNALSKCQASLHAAEENLPALLKAKLDYQQELAKKTAERNRQHNLYLQRAKDWKDAIVFLNEFIKVVNQKLANSPGSFADLGEKLLKHASRLGLVAEAVPVLIEMAQNPAESDVSIPHASNNYSYQAQGSTVNNLKTQLANLLTRLVTDAKTNDVNEQKAQALFNTLKAHLEGLIAKLSSDIVRTQKQISEMKDCVASEMAIISTASNKLRRNQTLQNAASHTCTDFAQEFVKATKNRLEEITTVQQIIDIVSKRFASLPKDLVSYLEEVKTHFRTYVNSTQFKKYEEYVQKHTTDNAHGRVLVNRAPRAVARRPRKPVRPVPRR
jgi:hypothetical protein